jgi:hypothetical protein
MGQGWASLIENLTMALFFASDEAKDALAKEMQRQKEFPEGEIEKAKELSIEGERWEQELDLALIRSAFESGLMDICDKADAEWKTIPKKGGAKKGKKGK